MKNNYLIAFILIVFVILFGKFFGLFSIFIPRPISIAQYVGEPTYPDGTRFDWFRNNGLVESSTAILTDGIDTYKFEVSKRSKVIKCGCDVYSNGRTIDEIYGGVNGDSWYQICDSFTNRPPYTNRIDYIDEYGCVVGYCSEGHTGGGKRTRPYGCYETDVRGMLDYKCDYSVKVYKNNQLIDTIDYPEGKSTVRNYGGITAQFMTQKYQSTGLTPSCISIANQYNINLPEDLIILNISTPKSEYMQGEDVKVDVHIENNLNYQLQGKIKTLFEVPTILGVKTEEKISEGEIKTGKSILTYSIPTDKRTENLKVTPSIEIYMPTEYFSGVNINFYPENILTAYNYKTEFFIGESKGETTEIRIKSIEEQLREELELTEEELAQLNKTLQEKLELIEEYKGDIQAQSDLINQLNLSIQEQAYVISQMELTLSDQAEIINNLNLKIQEQAELINNLKLNLEQKAILISQLQITNEEQAQLIEDMELSLSDQAEIISQLENLVGNDAEIILNLYDTIDEQAEIISELNYTNKQLANLVKDMQLTIDEQAQIIADLNLKLEDEQEIVNLLTDKVDEQQELIEKIQQYKQEGLSEYWWIFVLVGIFIFLLLINKKR